jgi:hypothetical protein
MHLRRWLPRKRRTLSAVVNRRAVTEGGVVARTVNVKGVQSNNQFKPTHFAASRRLQKAASGAPFLVRGLTWRWPDNKTGWVF